VLYVADAFQVIEKLNALLARRESLQEEVVTHDVSATSDA